MTLNTYICNPEFPLGQIDWHTGLQPPSEHFPQRPKASPCRSRRRPRLPSPSPSMLGATMAQGSHPPSAAPPLCPTKQLITRFREKRLPLLRLTCLHPNPALQPRGACPLCSVSPLSTVMSPDQGLREAGTTWSQGPVGSQGLCCNNVPPQLQWRVSVAPQ